MSTGTHHGRPCTTAERGNVREGLCATHASAAKSKRKTEASETLGRKHKEAEDTSKQPLVVFDALAPSDPQTHGCESLTKHTQTDTNGTRQDGPGDKFPPGRPHTPASSTPLCPQALPGWPLEWVTYPDSNTLWQRDLETDVSCHWHGSDEEMVSLVHAVYLSVRTEGGREGGRVDAWLEMLVEERRRGGGGWRRRLWWVVKGEINQVRAICGNGCCSVIRNPITQQLLWAVSRRRLTTGQTRIFILPPSPAWGIF